VNLPEETFADEITGDEFFLRERRSMRPTK
jgi:hypothetical protein